MPIEKYTASINTGKARSLESPKTFSGDSFSGLGNVDQSLEIAKIRNIVMIVIGVHGLISVLSLISSLLAGDKLVTGLIRTLLTAALLYQVLQAKNWARWVLVVLTALGALVLLFGSLALIALGGVGLGVFTIVLALGFLGCAVALVIPPGSTYFTA
jgi:hypothetical protein